MIPTRFFLTIMGLAKRTGFDSRALLNSAIVVGRRGEGTPVLPPA